MPYRTTDPVPEPDYSRAWRRYRAIKRSIIFVMLAWGAAVVGGVFICDPKQVGWIIVCVCWPASAVAVFVVLLLLYRFRCPRCGAWGFAHRNDATECPRCRLPMFAERPPDDGWKP